MSKVSHAPQEMKDLFKEVQDKYHGKTLATAGVAVIVSDAKAFSKGRFNWGKVAKFSPVYKLFQDGNDYDFLVTVPEEAWEFLNSEQRRAYADMFLSRCGVEYVPEMKADKKGKEKPVKDEWGRVKYTDEVKLDEHGEPKWVVLPLDIEVYTENYSRFGAWCEVFKDFSRAVSADMAKGVKKVDTPAA